ncbi:phospholipase, patatin family protein [Cadophora sp. MPI-SDFR-AT-0126]|nr:phospholipase, patatin family protein [Leotiomycetes sp. MPI-SDFR-AT-0126]
MSGLERLNATSSTVHGGIDSAASQLSQSPVATKGICLLSLDGGGVRGLSTLIILRYLMAKVNSGLPPGHHKKPYEIFDMIGGTSTGGLIAIMLGRLKMDVQECIDVYNSMFEEIFGSPVHKFKVTVALQIQSQFDSEILRRCILRIVAKSQNLADDDKKAIATATSLPGSQKAKDALISSAAAKVLLDDGEARGCRTFVCATAYETQNTVHFRDYPRADLGVPNKVTIVDAACATSAATSYFDAVVINGRTYRDGGFGANNPVNEVWHEAREVWVKDDYDDEVQLDKILKCFISIGTGAPRTEGMKESVKGFVDTLKNMVTQTKRSADDFMKSHRNLTKIDGRQRYFRFNVDQGLQEVGLEEYKKTPLVEAATEGYMESPDRENLVALCANNLKLKTSVSLLEEIPDMDFS